MIPLEEARKQVDTKKYDRLAWELDIAGRYLDAIRPQLDPETMPPYAKLVIANTPGDILVRSAQPIPGIWAELGRQGKNIEKSHFFFIQAIVGGAITNALQDLILSLQEISENAEAIEQGIQHVNGPRRAEECLQAVEALHKLLSSLNRKVLADVSLDLPSITG